MLKWIKRARRERVYAYGEGPHAGIVDRLIATCAGGVSKII